MIKKVIKSPFLIYKSLLDFIYPPYCSFCESILEYKQYLICETCWAQLPKYSCSFDQTELLAEKKFDDIYISHFNSIWQLNKQARFIIHEFKYNQYTRISHIIAKYMAELLNQDDKITNIDSIIPVPLHKKRQQKRGFNQSLLISSQLSKLTNIPANNKSLKRVRHTQTQTKLNIKERMENVANAFQIHKKHLITGKIILLVDDVITTGSTINACAKQLILNGAKKVFAISAAQT